MNRCQFFSFLRTHPSRVTRTSRSPCACPRSNEKRRLPSSKSKVSFPSPNVLERRTEKTLKTRLPERVMVRGRSPLLNELLYVASNNISIAWLSYFSSAHARKKIRPPMRSPFQSNWNIFTRSYHLCILHLDPLILVKGKKTVRNTSIWVTEVWQEKVWLKILTLSAKIVRKCAYISSFPHPANMFNTVEISSWGNMLLVSNVLQDDHDFDSITVSQ